MIKLSGALTVRSIHGRNGVFQVGRIATLIGEFTVKDALLEQYDDGKYEGDFGISKIYPVSYMTNGRLVVEIRAQIDSIALSNVEALAKDDSATAGDTDPLDEPSTVVAVSPAADESVTSVDADADVSLFAELWPLPAVVKLDPTIDRAKFRMQRDRLKVLGYKFQPLGQSWVRESVSEAA